MAPRRPSRVRTIAGRLIGLAAWTAFLVAVTLLAVEAKRALRMSPLEPWHERAPASEFTAKHAADGADFDDYLAREEAVFRELDAWLVDPAERRGMSEIIRYVRGGPGDPATFEPNWNRTQILVPDGGITGGALLLHGLTDSPYSMRSLAESLRDQGYLCICLRFPGHGTVPAGILKATADDWIAAAELAWAALGARVPAEAPLLLGGYSMGGAVAVLLTLDELERGGRAPDRLLLLSPAIGVTALARASDVHRLYSWIPFYRKAKWLSIEPEYDPFKYNSFPKHAGGQSWALAARVNAALAAAVEDGSIARMPPVLTFQSLVDSTVVARDILTRLYDRLPANGSEAVVFDVNRESLLDGFLSESVPDVAPLLVHPSLAYGVTLVTNAGPESNDVVARESPARSSEVSVTPIVEAWPLQVYSLAHVSIPFPPDDPIYGDGRHGPNGRLNIGDLSMRGERGVLVVSAEDLMRLRHNPFHAYVLERIGRFLPRSGE